MSYSILVASIVPLALLYLIKWLNFFETHRVRLILLALAWGAISTELSYLVDHPLKLVLGSYFVGVHSAPIVEEIFKSLILLYLVRRADTSFFVDGAVYGFASGIGFAIAENMLYLSRVDLDTGVVVATSRAFVASVLHGSTTAMVGMALAGFPLGRVNHPLLRWLIGLAVAITIHTTYNSTAFHHFVFGQTGLLVLAAIAFGALLLVAGAVLWGLRLERRRLRKALGIKAGASKGARRTTCNETGAIEEDQRPGAACRTRSSSDGAETGTEAGASRRGHLRYVVCALDHAQDILVDVGAARTDHGQHRGADQQLVDHTPVEACRA